MSEPLVGRLWETLAWRWLEGLTQEQQSELREVMAAGDEGVAGDWIEDHGGRRRYADHIRPRRQD